MSPHDIIGTIVFPDSGYHAPQAAFALDEHAPDIATPTTRARGGPVAQVRRHLRSVHPKSLTLDELVAELVLPRNTVHAALRSLFIARRVYHPAGVPGRWRAYACGLEDGVRVRDRRRVQS